MEYNIIYINIYIYIIIIIIYIYIQIHKPKLPYTTVTTFNLPPSRSRYIHHMLAELRGEVIPPLSFFWMSVGLPPKYGCENGLYSDLMGFNGLL